MSIERDQIGLSKLYLASRDGKVAEVEQLLPYLSLYELNRIESNGSTALHAAAHYGHVSIVEYLVRHGGVHRKLHNGYNRMPAEETQNVQIKQLLGQEDTPYKSRERFIHDYGVRAAEVFSPVSHGPTTSKELLNEWTEETRLKWLDTYLNARRIAMENREYMHNWLTKVPLHKILGMIYTDYIQTITEFDKKYLIEIKTYLDQAFEENDMRYLVYVYTMPTIKFYQKLNLDLASRGSDFRFESHVLDKYHDDEPPTSLGPYLFSAAIMHHPSLVNEYYTGTTYRGMSISQDALNEYVVGARVITNTFLSTSTTIDMSDNFMDFVDSTVRPVLCVYRTTQPHTSISIRNISAVKDEDEVLILPFAVFRVQRVDINAFQFPDGKATVIFLDQDADESTPWPLCPSLTDLQQLQPMILLSKDSEQEQIDSSLPSANSASQELASSSSNNRIDFYRTFISKLEETTQMRMPWSFNKNLLVDLLIDAAVYIQESSISGEIEEFDLRYTCRAAIKARNPSETNIYQLVTAFVRLISTGSLEIFVPRRRHIYSFLNRGLQDYFTSLYLVRREPCLDVEVVANRFLHYMTDSRYRRPLLLALEYISSEWMSNDADLFYQLLLNEKQQLPLGSILLMTALPHLLHCMPSSSTINIAFDLFMAGSIVQKWLIRFPSFMEYLDTALNHLPSDLANKWLTHYLDTYSDSASIYTLSYIFLQIIRRQRRIPTFVTSAHCETLWKKVAIDDDVKSPMDRFLAAVSIFDFTLIPRNDLSHMLPTREIMKIHPTRLALIIALNGGLYRGHQQEVVFSPNYAHRNSSVPSFQLLSENAHWFESAIEQKIEEDTSQETVDLFVAWICLAGVDRPWIYEKFANWPAFRRAIARFRRIGLYLNECYVVDYAELTVEFKADAAIKNIATEILQETNTVSLTQSITIALARLILPNGKYSFFLKHGSNSSVVRLLDLPLPIQLLSDVNNPNRELPDLFQLLFPMFPQSYLLVKSNDRVRNEILRGTDFLLNHTCRYQIPFLLALLSKPLQALYASLLDDGTLQLVVLMVEIGIQLFKKRTKGSAHYSLVLAFIKNAYDKCKLSNYYRALVCLCTVRDNVRHDFVDFDAYVSKKEQLQAFRLPLKKGSRETWLKIELDEERQRATEASDVDLYVRAVSLAILSAASYERDEVPQSLIDEVMDGILLLHEPSLRLHALTVVWELGLASTSYQPLEVNQMALSILPSFTETSLGVHAWLFISWLSAFELHDNIKAIRNELGQILDRLDANIDENSIEIQQAVCESLLSLDHDNYPNVRSRVYRVVKHSGWSNNGSAVSKILQIDSSPFINSTLTLNPNNIGQAALMASMYLIQLSVDVHKLLTWFEKPRELKSNVKEELPIVSLIRVCNDYGHLLDGVELAINVLLSSEEVNDEESKKALWVSAFKEPWPHNDSKNSSEEERQYVEEYEHIKANPVVIGSPIITVQMCYLMLNSDDDMFCQKARSYLNVTCLFSSRLGIQGLVDLFHLALRSYRSDPCLIHKSVSEIDLRIDREDHLKLLLDWEQARITGSRSMSYGVLKLEHGLQLQEHDLTRSLLQCVYVSLTRPQIITIFFQYANKLVLTSIDKPTYLAELVLFATRYWIDTAPEVLSVDEQDFVHKLIFILSRCPPVLAKAIVPALIVNRSSYPYIPFGTLDVARQFVKRTLRQATKKRESYVSHHLFITNSGRKKKDRVFVMKRQGVRNGKYRVFGKVVRNVVHPKKRTTIDEETLALMIQHYYHDSNSNDESLLIKLKACSWSKIIAKTAAIAVLRRHCFNVAEPKPDDLLAVFDGQYLSLYHAFMILTNDFPFQLAICFTAPELILAHVDDLLTLFIKELHSSVVHHQSSQPSNHIQVAIVLLDKIPTRLRLAVKKHNDDIDQDQEKFKRALLAMSKKFDSNSHHPFLLLIKLYGELTLEMSNFFLTAAKCQPKQMKNFCGYIVEIEQVNSREVVEHLQTHLTTAQSLQQRYVAACLLVQLVKRDQVSIREVQRILSETINDRRAINGTVTIIDDNESITSERLDQALFDLLLELSFLSSSASLSSSQSIEQPAIKLDTNNFDWEFNQIIGADKYASCVLIDSSCELVRGVSTPSP